MGEQRHFIHGLDPPGCTSHGLADIAPSSCDHARRFRCVRKLPDNVGARELSVRSGVPDDVESGEPLPCRAHVIAFSSRTTWRTCLMFLALVSLTCTSLPPRIGHAATVAIFIPGIWTSMPNMALPLTLSGPSNRFAEVPISRYSSGFLSGTFSGTGSLAALSASSA